MDIQYTDIKIVMNTVSGWIKIILEESEDGYLHTCKLSPEQKNWLSLNGYIVED